MNQRDVVRHVEMLADLAERQRVASLGVNSRSLSGIPPNASSIPQLPRRVQVTAYAEGDKTRIVLLPAAAAEFTQLRGNAGPGDPVFVARSGCPLTAGQAYRVVKAARTRRAFRPSDGKIPLVQAAASSRMTV